ncbi:MAG: right-handed parallel beta-helix repeat-containing protein, partial [Phycisphaerales bacterium]|nr:right-handed parallel beta-helix repeat-containing protein [Phycisphaerales bacterium]
MMFRIAMSFGVLALCGVAGAATWTVDDDGPADFNNIQDAVEAASNSDEVIVAPGTYTGTGDEVVDMKGRAITLRASGTAEETIIDGEGQRRVVYCSSGEDADTVIEGFTITGGSDSHGGGVYCNNSSPTISGCTISNNTANYSGGGIYCTGTGSNPSISDCTISNNTATSDGDYGYGGGGIYCTGSSTPT